MILNCIIWWGSSSVYCPFQSTKMFLLFYSFYQTVSIVLCCLPNWFHCPILSTKLFLLSYVVHHFFLGKSIFQIWFRDLESSTKWKFITNLPLFIIFFRFEIITTYSWYVLVDQMQNVVGIKYWGWPHTTIALNTDSKMKIFLRDLNFVYFFFHIGLNSKISLNNDLVDIFFFYFIRCCCLIF